MSAKPHVFQVTDDVYCVMRRSYYTCAYFVRSAKGLIAIDAGMKSSGSEMLFSIRELGQTPSDVRAILLTHWHNDHAAGAHELAKLSGAPVYYSALEAAHLTRTVATRGLRGVISAAIPETGPLVLLKGLLGNAPQNAVEANRFVKGGEIVEDDFEVLDTPGHTIGHVSYFWKPRGVLFAGDAMAVIRGRLRFMARPATEDLAKARQSMRFCLSLPINAICPGHREPLRDAKPECARMRTYLDNNGSWPLFG